MQLKMIRNNKDHQLSLARLKQLLASRSRKAVAVQDEIQILGMLIERYEQARYPLDLVDPVEAIELEIEQRGFSPKDLVPYLGAP